MPRLVRIRARNTRARDDDAATPPHASNITAAAAAVVAVARALETPVTERAATQRRRARSTPRGSLEVRARIRRARMPAGMAGRTPHRKMPPRRRTRRRSPSPPPPSPPLSRQHERSDRCLRALSHARDNDITAEDVNTGSFVE